MKNSPSIFKPAEWVVIIVSSLVLFYASQGMKSPYKEIFFFLPSFWIPVARHRAEKLNKVNSTNSTNKSSNQDSEKYNQLLRMVGGDRGVADRLIALSGLDKAISDLERDRRIR